MREVVLYNWPFKIVEDWKHWWLTFAKIVYEWKEVPIRFKLTNLEKIVDYICERFWHRNKIINPITQVPEERPLKQHLKNPDCRLFYR